MTHHTEAERAEFEGWLMQKLDAVDWSIQEVKDWYFTQRPDGRYAQQQPNDQWEAWQAARRAPAAPVPQQVEAAIDALVFAAVIEGGVSNDRAKDARAATHQRKAELLSMLAVAPQPPEVGCSVSNGETEEEPRAFETHVAAPVPQARKPLTDEECDRLISALCPDFTDERFPTDRPVMRQLARDAIAHGIGATNGQ